MLRPSPRRRVLSERGRRPRCQGWAGGSWQGCYMLSKKGNLRQAKVTHWNLVTFLYSAAWTILTRPFYLTLFQIWDEVERSDKGCTRGGGRNNMAIFSDAGLLFVSNQEKTAPRQRRSNLHNIILYTITTFQISIRLLRCTDHCSIWITKLLDKYCSWCSLGFFNYVS